MSKKTLPKEVQDFLAPRYMPGKKKLVAKDADKEYIDKQKKAGEKIDKGKLELKKWFYNKATFNKVAYTTLDFMKYVRDNNDGKRIAIDDIEKLKPFIQGYLNWKLENGYSPYSVVNYKTHLSKAFQIDLDKKTSKIIVSSKNLPTKNRIAMDQVKGFNYKENLENENIRLWTTIGCRRGDFCILSKAQVGTLQKARGVDYSKYTDKNGSLKNIRLEKSKNGNYYIRVVKSKKSKENKRYIVDQSKENIDFIRKKLEDYDTLINLPNHAPIQMCRRQYAQDYYNSIKRSSSEMYREEIYYCRGNNKGKFYDRKALGIVAYSLGHGIKNRENTIIHHYLD